MNYRIILYLIISGFLIAIFSVKRNLWAFPESASLSKYDSMGGDELLKISGNVDSWIDINIALVKTTVINEVCVLKGSLRKNAEELKGNSEFVSIAEQTISLLVRETKVSVKEKLKEFQKEQQAI